MKSATGAKVTAHSASPRKPGVKMGRPRNGEQRAPSKEDLVAAVIRMAENGNTDAVNMRSLAAALGVSAKLLYRYVSSKEELLDMVADDILGRWKMPERTLSWRDRLTTITRTGFRLAGRFPDLTQRSLLRMLHSQYLPGAGRVLDAIKDCLLEAGLSSAESEQVKVVYYTFILGGLAMAHAAMTHEAGGQPSTLAKRDIDRALNAGVQYLILGIDARTRQP